MATESIFRNIVIDTPEKAEAFISAIEEAARIAGTKNLPKVEARDLTEEEMIKYFGEPKKRCSK